MADAFTYHKSEAFAESVHLRKLAEKYGTPLYVYSLKQIVDRCEAIRLAFSSYPTLICFAVKANSNLSILDLIFQNGLGADVVSIGELERALKAGATGDSIVFSGVGKKREEIERALFAEIFSINAESMEELRQIAEVARQSSKIARISLRINPDINVKTHPHIATGLYETKFGIPERELKSALALIRKEKGLNLIGISCHLGSQIFEMAPFQKAAKRLASLSRELRSLGFPLESIDLGGGFGVRYEREKTPSIQEYAKTILKEIKPTELKLILEPGRWLVAEAGIVLTQVILTKETPKRRFVIVDAAMTELIRPSLYDAHHEILPVIKKTNTSKKVDIVGPVCETGDFLGRDRKLPPLSEGDLLFVKNAGAYGASMGSAYNARPRAAEVLVNGAEAHLIRRRETVEELWGLEA